MSVWEYVCCVYVCVLVSHKMRRMCFARVNKCAQVTHILSKISTCLPPPSSWKQSGVVSMNLGTKAAYLEPWTNHYKGRIIGQINTKGKSSTHNWQRMWNKITAWCRTLYHGKVLVAVNRSMAHWVSMLWEAFPMTMWPSPRGAMDKASSGGLLLHDKEFNATILVVLSIIEEPLSVDSSEF